MSAQTAVVAAAVKFRATSSFNYARLQATAVITGVVS